jgi:4-amino-4-deoxy-L-arabinose transferase-like glycosyltransferase
MQTLLRGTNRLFRSDVRIPQYIYVLAIILLVAFDLRIQSVIHSVVDTPVRADARQYVLYAHNLKNYGIYSLSDTLSTNGQATPKPDAIRPPFYPFFLTLFLDRQPTEANIATITRVQAVISTLTVLVVFWLSRLVLPLPLALAASAFTAISPHLITMNIYLLSETLFCFLLVLTIYALAKTAERQSLVTSALAGLALGAAALTHLMLLYYVLPLAVFLLGFWGWKNGWRKTVMLVLGFSLLYGTWIARNINTLGVPGDNTQMSVTLRIGAYNNMMYQNDPRTYGFPYRFDPHYEETSKDLPSVISAVVNEFKEAPIEQLRWYILGKPLMLWSWNIIAGQGDVFVYPVVSTPYSYLPHFQATHAVMHATHWIFVVLMIGGIIIAWLPPVKSGFSNEAVFIARAISVLLLYHAAVMMIGFPEPRYAIPMRPFLYIMAMLPIAVAIRWILTKRSSLSGISMNHADRKPE